MAVKTYDNSENVQLTKNFKLWEFRCKCGCGTTLHDDQLSGFLQKIRDYFGRPVYINSGYRCEKHNRAVGGAAASRHMKGQAADIAVDGIAPAEVAKFAESIGILGIGLYETEKDGYFVHVDTRPYKSFWYGQGQAYRSTFGGGYSREVFLEELRKALGINGEDLILGTVTVGAKYNNRHECIKPVQKRLAALGYEEVGQADGCAGSMFTSALAHFQQDRGCTPTGIAEEWGRTWQELLAAE